MENNVVFRHENKNHRACEIISLDDEYMIRLEGRGGREYFAYFDKNERALEAVKKNLRLYGTIECRPSGFVFTKIEQRAHKSSCRLGQVLYSVYHPQEVRENIKRIRYVNGDQTNLRSWNLRLDQSTKVEIVALNSREHIWVSAVTRAGDFRFAVTDYDAELFSILDNQYIYFDDSKRMFYVGGFYNGGSKTKYPLSYLVIARSVYGATLEDWREQAEKLRQSLHKDEEMSVDHKKATGAQFGRWDNRKRNLQIISRTLNSSKGGCTKTLCDNCFYIPTETGALYGRHNDAAGMTEVREMTNNPTAAEIDDLRHFCRTGKWNDGEEYNSYPLGSKKSVDVIIQELSETRFYQEVLNQL